MWYSHTICTVHIYTYVTSLMSSPLDATSVAIKIDTRPAKLHISNKIIVTRPEKKQSYEYKILLVCLYEFCNLQSVIELLKKFCTCDEISNFYV